MSNSKRRIAVILAHLDTAIGTPDLSGKTS
jgi:hypothetical protein